MKGLFAYLVMMCALFGRLIKIESSLKLNGNSAYKSNLNTEGYQKIKSDSNEPANLSKRVGQEWKSTLFYCFEDLKNKTTYSRAHYRAHFQ